MTKNNLPFTTKYISSAGLPTITLYVCTLIPIAEQQ